MKIRLGFKFFIWAMVFWGITGCTSTSLEPTSNSTTVSAGVREDAKTDASLGTLPKQGTSEAEKLATAIESEENADRAAHDIHKQELRDDIFSLQNSITEFDKLNDQVQN